MVQLAGLDIGDEHPLVLELTSLRTAVARFQDEAHNLSVKLQRHSLDTSNSHDRVLHLERENALLRSELTVLRANPHPDASPASHPASLQVQQLTLSLRRLSDKLSVTESALQARTTELAHAVSEAAKAKHTVEGAYELAARTRGREEEGKVRERELERKVRAAEEERKMSDLVVNEYADLVRSLEGRSSTNHSRSTSSVIEGGIPVATPSTSTVTLVDSLSEGKSGLQKLLSEFSAETERLQSELIHLHGELATSESKLEAERKGAEYDRAELAKAQFELEKLKMDDTVAAKMVSRYMKFSQSSTDTLQVALTSLKTRHAATVDTLTTHLSTLATQLRHSQDTTEKLRFALDELSGDIMRETFGRRREVALRIRLVGREEGLSEGLARWIRKAEEVIGRSTTEDTEATRSAFGRMVQDARALLSILDGTTTDSVSSGSLTRLMAAQSAVEMLTEELRAENARRMELEKAVVNSRIPDKPKIGRADGEEYDLAEESLFSPEPRKELATPGRDEIVKKPLIPPKKLSLDQSTYPSSLSVPIPKPLPDTPTTSGTETPPNDPVNHIHIHLDSASDLLAPQAAQETLEVQKEPVASVEDGAAKEPLPAGPSDDQRAISLAPSLEHMLELQRDIPASDPDAGATSLLNGYANHTSTRPESDSDKSLPVTQPLQEAISSDVLPPDTVQAQEYQEELKQEPTSGTATQLPSMATDPSDPFSPDEATFGASMEPPLLPQIQVPQIIVASDDILPSTPPDTTLDDDASQPLPVVESGIPILTQLPPEHVSHNPTPTLIDNSIILTENLNVTDPPHTPRHSLLADLTDVSHRYDDLQRAFRDCHLALQDLKKSISPSTSPTSSTAFPTISSSKPFPTAKGYPTISISTSLSPRNGSATSPILQTAIERLNDYTEDARVELEIRTADEALLARGFETLLSIPGALSTSTSIQPLPVGDSDPHESTPTQSEVETQIKQFTSGTDASVQKALQGFTQKLGDIQHDIAVLKRAVHDPELSPSPSPTTPPAGNSTGSGWASWIRTSPSRSVSATLGSGPAPTFGNVMTTPRLRHSPSLNFYGDLRKGSATNDAPKDPFAFLGLKVPMPNYVHVTPAQEPPAQRPRTLSAMYMLGLGPRSTTGSFVSSPQKPAQASDRRKDVQGEMETDTEGEEGDTEGEDTDVE